MVAEMETWYGTCQSLTDPSDGDFGEWWMLRPAVLGSTCAYMFSKSLGAPENHVFFRILLDVRLLCFHWKWLASMCKMWGWPPLIGHVRPFVISLWYTLRQSTVAVENLPFLGELSPRDLHLQGFPIATATFDCPIILITFHCKLSQADFLVWPEVHAGSGARQLGDDFGFNLGMWNSQVMPGI